MSESNQTHSETENETTTGGQQRSESTSNQEHFGTGDQIARDKIENHIKIDYKEQSRISICPYCEEEFEENPERKSNRIKCGKCDEWSYDQHFEARMAAIFPNVPGHSLTDFTNLKSRIDNEIRLGKYEDALKNSEKLTKLCPEAPHSFLYNALSIYYNQSKEDIIKGIMSMGYNEVEAMYYFNPIDETKRQGLNKWERKGDDN